MKKNLVIGFFALLALLRLCVAGARAEITSSTGMIYSTGKYGESTSTEIFCVPLIETWEDDKWSVKLTIPYLRIKGPGDVTPGLGQVGQGTNQTNTKTESGIGDVVVSGGYDFYQNRKTGTTLGVTGKIKFGTASREKGLGTGENDYYLQLDGASAIGDFTPFATIGYRVVGSPSGYELKNVFYGSVGSTYRWNPRDVIGASLDLREKITDAGSAAAELAVFYVRKITAAWRAQGYALTGFTKASPNIELGVIVSFKF